MGEIVKVSDIVISEIVKVGVDTFFGVTGGAAVHFFDSIEINPDCKSIFLNHEQAAAFAVESYAKAKNSIGAGIFTTGPGGTNALTGLAAAWLDSIPCIFISGQVRSNQTVNGRMLRQVGTQEVDIVAMVKPVTKYAVTIYDVCKVKYHIQKAIYLATHGRPGPVWIDIPVDISWSYIDNDEFINFDPSSEDPNAITELSTIDIQVLRIIDLLCTSERPVILVGYGVRLSGCEVLLKELVEKYNIPIVTSWNMSDWLPTSHPLNIGRPGLSGQRGANMVLQNSDLIIAIGSHLSVNIIGTRPEYFARDARIVVVDVDDNEIDHCPLALEVAVRADASIFVDKLNNALHEISFNKNTFFDWIKHIKLYKDLNCIALGYINNRERVNSYYFQYLLSKSSAVSDIFVVDGGGTVVYSSFQSIEIKDGQKILLSTGLCSMGSGLPEAIGAHFALPDKRIFCFVGDGSFPFNMQELQIIKNLSLPIIVIVFNNKGYVSIRTTQNDFLGGRIVGSSPSSGLHLPIVMNIATAFDIPYISIDTQENLGIKINDILSFESPLIVEVMVSPEQEIVPRQGFAQNNDGTYSPKPLEDMYPFLDKEILQSLMKIQPVSSKTCSSAREINLMKNYPKSNRSSEQRSYYKKVRTGFIGLNEYGNVVDDILFEQLILEKARSFGKEYFDGNRIEGYGGYSYNPKYWHRVATDIIAEYGLKPGDSVLEIGCAKGFLLNDLQEIIPGLIVRGIDISKYAVNQALPSVKSNIEVGDAQNLPYQDNSFDLVISINMLSELPINSCKLALKEIIRVSKMHSFITVNSWRNKREKEKLFAWNISALTNLSTNDWLDLFCEVQYQGDYYWFFAN